MTINKTTSHQRATASGLLNRPGPSTTVAKARNKKKPYKVVFETVTQEKKTLRSTVSYNPNAPDGYRFVPAGTHQDLVERCKELSRQRGLNVFTVSATPKSRSHLNPEKLSHHIHRIGFHFSAEVVTEACNWLGYTLNGDYYDKIQHDLDSAASLARRRAKNPPQASGKKANALGPPKEKPEELRRTLSEQFPNMPPEDLADMVDRAYADANIPTIWTAPESLPRRAQLATLAHIRHTHTDYDNLLRTAPGGYKEAREVVEPQCLDIIVKWRGENRGDKAEIEEIFREFIVIDSDDEDDDSVFEDEARDSSVEIVSRPAHAHELAREEISRPVPSANDSNGPFVFVEPRRRASTRRYFIEASRTSGPGYLPRRYIHADSRRPQPPRLPYPPDSTHRRESSAYLSPRQAGHGPEAVMQSIESEPVYAQSRRTSAERDVHLQRDYPPIAYYERPPQTPLQKRRSWPSPERQDYAPPKRLRNDPAPGYWVVREPPRVLREPHNGYVNARQPIHPSHVPIDLTSPPRPQNRVVAPLATGHSHPSHATEAPRDVYQHPTRTDHPVRYSVVERPRTEARRVVYYTDAEPMHDSRQGRRVVEAGPSRQPQGLIDEIGDIAQLLEVDLECDQTHVSTTWILGQQSTTILIDFFPSVKRARKSGTSARQPTDVIRASSAPPTAQFLENLPHEIVCTVEDASQTMDTPGAPDGALGAHGDSRAAIIVPTSLTKTVKTALETAGFFDKKEKIRRVAPAEIPQTFFHPLCLIRSTIRLHPCEDPNVAKQEIMQMLGLSQHTDDVIVQAWVSEPGGQSIKPLNKSIPGAVSEWFNSLSKPAKNNATFEDISMHIPSSYNVYGPLLELPPQAFGPDSSFQNLLRLEPSDISNLYKTIADRMRVSHIARRQPIPAKVTSPDDQNRAHPNDNVLRSPLSIQPLHGDFGPVTLPGIGPNEFQLDQTFWAFNRQNGIWQVWAPLHTMFSQGNIKEKARIKELAARSIEGPSELFTAVDLYAGIGYFAFSYCSSDLCDRVLCWELNPWSVEGLKRGAAKNKFSVTQVPCEEASDQLDDLLRAASSDLVIFNEDNANALERIELIRPYLTPVRHINCGLLPTSRESWRTAVQALAPDYGWIHLHENLAEDGMDGLVKEITKQVEVIAAEVAGYRESDAQVDLEHVEKVKTYAPSIWHCVLDYRISQQSKRLE